MLALAGCLSNPTVTVDQQSLAMPQGAATDVLVSIDGTPVTAVDELLWTIENDHLVSVTKSYDGYHLRVGGNFEGTTVVHVYAYGQDVAIPTRVDPPAILEVWTEPLRVHATVGTEIQLRAKALDTLARVRDVTLDSRWAIRDTNVADIDRSGMMLHAMAEGETTLHVLHDTVNAVVPVAVFK
jgi:hypothetical protein